MKDAKKVYHKKETETNLTINSCSIKLGRHITGKKPNLFSTIYVEGMNRELKEEINIDSDYYSSLAAVLNNYSNEASKVHLNNYSCLNTKRSFSKETRKVY